MKASSQSMAWALALSLAGNVVLGMLLASRPNPSAPPAAAVPRPASPKPAEANAAGVAQPGTGPDQPGAEPQKEAPASALPPVIANLLPLLYSNPEMTRGFMATQEATVATEYRLILRRLQLTPEQYEGVVRALANETASFMDRITNAGQGLLPGQDPGSAGLAAAADNAETRQEILRILGPEKYEDFFEMRNRPAVWDTIRDFGERLDALGMPQTESGINQLAEVLGRHRKPPGLALDSEQEVAALLNDARQTMSEAQFAEFRRQIERQALLRRFNRSLPGGALLEQQ